MIWVANNLQWLRGLVQRMLLAIPLRKHWHHAVIRLIGLHFDDRLHQSRTMVAIVVPCDQKVNDPAAP